jgi:hypothetical protein
MKWVKAKKRNIYHLVINNYYVCNKAIGKIYTKKTIIPSTDICCKNCLRYCLKLQRRKD